MTPATQLYIGCAVSFGVLTYMQNFIVYPTSGLLGVLVSMVALTVVILGFLRSILDSWKQVKNFVLNRYDDKGVLRND